MLSITIQILELIYCTKEERIYTANCHKLIFCAEKSGSGWVGGWMGGWVDGRAVLRIAYSNQK